MDGQPKVYSYRRFSTPEQQQGDSLRRQTAMAEAWAAARGLELDEALTFEDLGVSAFHGRNVDQGALGQFLRAVEDGLVAPGSVLLVESLDRLSRQAARKALRALEDIVESGVKVVTLDSGREYTAESLDGFDLIEFILRATLAHDESVKKQARLRQVWADKRDRATRQGSVLTARGPAWLKLEDGRWRVLEDKAAVVRRVFELAANGVGVVAIAGLLNRQRVPTMAGGKMWSTTYVRRLLNSPSVIGRCEPKRVVFDGKRKRKRREPTGEVLEDYFPAIVEMDVWETVQAMQASKAPRMRGTGEPRVSHILAGLATCPRCAAVMSKVLKNGRPRLVCGRAKMGGDCVYRSIDLETLETAIVNGLDRAVAEAPGPDEEIAEQVDQIEKEIAGTEDAIERLLDALQRAPESQAIVDRLTAAEATLSQLQDRHGELLREALLADPRGHLKRQQRAVEAVTAQPMDVMKANATLRAAVNKIEVDHLEGRLHVHWVGDGVSSITYSWPSK